MTEPSISTVRLANGLSFRVRAETSDTNSAIACSLADEYGLRSYDLHGKVVYDIGAHIGGVSMLAALLGASRVIAVEPVPENAALIRESVALNGYEDIISVVEAAAGEPGGMTLSYGWSGEGAYGEVTGTVHAFIGNTGLIHSGYVAQHVIEVPTVTMADLVTEHGIPYFVKMDCEGGEWPLLEEDVTTTIPVIVGEYHPWVGSPTLDSPHFTDNRAEVAARIGHTHALSFSGPDGIDAGFFKGDLLPRSA